MLGLKHVLELEWLEFLFESVTVILKFAVCDMIHEFFSNSRFCQLLDGVLWQVSFPLDSLSLAWVRDSSDAETRWIGIAVSGVEHPRMLQSVAIRQGNELIIVEGAQIQWNSRQEGLVSFHCNCPAEIAKQPGERLQPSENLSGNCKGQRTYKKRKSVNISAPEASVVWIDQFILGLMNCLELIGLQEKKFNF